jgi:2-methylcitrate dehydratase PrpD
VVVTFADGRKEQARQGRNVRGRIENPMTDAEVETKADELFRSVMSSARAEAAIALAWRLYEKSNLSELVEALGP